MNHLYLLSATNTVSADLLATFRVHVMSIFMVSEDFVSVLILSRVVVLTFQLSAR